MIKTDEELQNLFDYMMKYRVPFEEEYMEEITKRRRVYSSSIKKMIKKMNQVKLGENIVLRVVVNQVDTERFLKSVSMLEYKKFVDVLMYLIFNIHDVQNKVGVKDRIDFRIINELINDIKFVVFSNGLFYVSFNLDYDEIEESLIEVNSTILRVGKEKVNAFVIKEGQIINVGKYELGASTTVKTTEYRRTITNLMNRVREKSLKFTMRGEDGKWEARMKDE